MCAMIFSDAELRKSWRNLSNEIEKANKKNNTHRLLMFYAIECGLKCVWLKRNAKSLFEKNEISKFGHNLKLITKELRIGPEIALDEKIELKPIKHHGRPIKREGAFEEIHQVWRYGGSCKTPTDHECEIKLQKALNWIKENLR